MIVCSVDHGLLAVDGQRTSLGICVDAVADIRREAFRRETFRFWYLDGADPVSSICPHTDDSHSSTSSVLLAPAHQSVQRPLSSLLPPINTHPT